MYTSRPLWDTACEFARKLTIIIILLMILGGICLYILSQKSQFINCIDMHTVCITISNVVMVTG